MIRQVAFRCDGSECVGSLHEAEGHIGVLIVSGGVDIRSGAHRWQADLGRVLGDAGFPVFRYDRRGVGDSAGERTDWRSAEPDLRAALAAFRAHRPELRSVVGLGNCDGATTLALFGQAVGLAGLLLLNPWVTPLVDDLPPPAAIRARYRARLLDADAWRRLARGQIDCGKAVRGLVRIARPASAGLAGEIADALGRAAAPPAQLILATGDATALACRAAWRTRPFAALRRSIPVTEIDTESHSFAGDGDAERLAEAVLAALRRFA